MTKTARADGHRRVIDRISPARGIPLPPPEAEDSNDRQPVTASVVVASSMPIHDPATLEKFRQAAAACRSSRAKSRTSISGATVATAGNGGVGRCTGGVESAALVPLSPSLFGHHASASTTAETRFSQHSVDRCAAAAVADDDDESVDDCERARRERARGRRRSTAVITTARWLHRQLLPSKTGGDSGGRSPPPFAGTSDDESATSDVETNLLQRAPVRRDLRICSVDDGDRRRSRDTFYSSTTTDDRFRLSTTSDSVSGGARPASSGDSPEVFRRVAFNNDDDDDDAQDSCVDLGGRRRTSSDTDAVTTTNNAASSNDADDASRVSDDASVAPALLMPKPCPVLRFELLRDHRIVSLRWPRP